jgi:nitrite reductase/ring-hydroxylating ferredoxin subunit
MPDAEHATAVPEDKVLTEETAVPEDKVLITAGDRTFLIDAACPHRKGRLAFGHINDNTLRITCPLHRSTYDLTDGHQISGPAACALNVEELR